MDIGRGKEESLLGTMLRECQKGNILKTEVVCVSKLFIGCPKFVKFVKKSEEKYTEAAASD